MRLQGPSPCTLKTIPPYTIQGQGEGIEQLLFISRRVDWGPPKTNPKKVLSSRHLGQSALRFPASDSGVVGGSDPPKPLPFVFFIDHRGVDLVFLCDRFPRISFYTVQLGHRIGPYKNSGLQNMGHCAGPGLVSRCSLVCLCPCRFLHLECTFHQPNICFSVTPFAVSHS